MPRLYRAMVLFIPSFMTPVPTRTRLLETLACRASRSTYPTTLTVPACFCRGSTSPDPGDAGMLSPRIRCDRRAARSRSVFPIAIQAGLDTWVQVVNESAIGIAGKTARGGEKGRRTGPEENGNEGRAFFTFERFLIGGEAARRPSGEAEDVKSLSGVSFRLFSYRYGMFLFAPSVLVESGYAWIWGRPRGGSLRPSAS